MILWSLIFFYCVLCVCVCAIVSLSRSLSLLVSCFAPPKPFTKCHLQVQFMFVYTKNRTFQSSECWSFPLISTHTHPHNIVIVLKSRLSLGWNNPLVLFPSFYFCYCKFINFSVVFKSTINQQDRYYTIQKFHKYGNSGKQKQ